MKVERCWHHSNSGEVDVDPEPSFEYVSVTLTLDEARRLGDGEVRTCVDLQNAVVKALRQVLSLPIPPPQQAPR